MHHDHDEELDPAVRRILYGEDEAVARAADVFADQGADEGPLPQRPVRHAPPGGEMDIAIDAGSVVLAAAISDERRGGHFDGSWEERIVPAERAAQVRDAVEALGLPVQEGDPPPGLSPRIRTVPAEALWNGPDQPSGLLGAVCEALTDPSMMELVARAVNLVRFGLAAGEGGGRGIAAHNVGVAPPGAAHGEGLQLRGGEIDGQLAEVSCPCGFRSQEPLPAREALTQAAVHVRFEIEERLRLLSIAAQGERDAAVEAANSIAGGGE